MALIKICGITNKIDAVNASKLGVDMLGFVFYKDSKRYVSPKEVRQIVNELPNSIARVGVFVDEEKKRVCDIAEEAGIDTLQFHGNETPWYCADFKGKYKVIKAFRIKDKKSLKIINDYDVDFDLLDTYKNGVAGGTGEIFDRSVLKDFEFLRPEILSGGLNPDNVRQAILEILPYGVDVSSGVEESCGKKSLKLMKRFVQEVRKT